MKDPELEESFPGLIGSSYEPKSPVDPGYNCVSFAVGDLKYFWDDVAVNGYYWPPGVNSATLEGWVTVFSIHGYRDDSTDDTLEPEYEKIAIYGLTAEVPEHVARQKASGVWVSKLGRGKDIEHATLDALNGSTYGKVIKIMKRKCRDGRRVLE